MVARARHTRTFVVAAAALLSSTCLTICGTAAADVTEWLEDLANVISHDGVLPLDTARNETRVALAPATKFAAQDRARGERITEAACRYNEKLELGEPLYGFFHGYSDSEREATQEQAAELAKHSVKFVKAVCSNVAS